MGLLKEQREPAEIARTLGISEKAMVSLIHRKAQSGSIRITGIEPTKGEGNNER